MRDGSYRKKIDFEAFEVLRFIPHFYSVHRFGGHGCGANALGLLTGIQPNIFPHRKDWTPRFMARILRLAGFQVSELTKRNITRSKYPYSNITRMHVLLARLKFMKNNASWVVIHQGLCYHNFEVSPMGPYTLINQPLMGAFLLQHPCWMSGGQALRSASNEPLPGSILLSRAPDVPRATPLPDDVLASTHP